MMKCSYCQAELIDGSGQVVRRYRRTASGMACNDIEACDKREAASHASEMAGLRKRQREGDELSGAEQAMLAE